MSVLWRPTSVYTKPYDGYFHCINLSIKFSVIVPKLPFKSFISKLFYKIFSLFNTLFFWLKPLVVTWVYISVILEFSWPGKFWIYLKSVPFSNKWVAKLWCKVCTVTCFLLYTRNFKDCSGW